MATDLRPPGKTAAAPYEAVVDRQLNRACLRLRGLDGAASALVLVCLVVGYGLVMSVADRMWGLSATLRLGAWCVWLVGLLFFLGATINRLLVRRANPLFLARRLEQTLPDATNSVVDSIDLRNETLPPAIRGSLGRRAAKDLASADPEQAISA